MDNASGFRKQNGEVPYCIPNLFYSGFRHGCAAADCVFNLFNSVEFANPITTYGSLTFGEITTTYPDSFRIVQLAGKVRF